MKRSNVPIIWSLFGAGGALAALLGPVLVFITGIAAPAGQGLPADTLTYARMLAFAQHWAGKVFLLAVVSLFLWHAAHRIYYCLHDFGVRAGTGVRLLLYGSALAGTVATAWILLAIGF